MAFFIMSFIFRFTPLPDSVLARNLGGQAVTTIDPSSGLASAIPKGLQTPGLILCF